MRIILSSCCISLLAFCTQPNIDTTSEGERLMQVSRDWSNTAATGNVDSILSYWADDAIVMEPGRPALHGKDEIRAMLEGASKVPGFRISWEPLAVSVSESGDMAYLIERSQVTVNDSVGNPQTQSNKAVTIWRKGADGKWRNVVDIWNAE